MATDESSSPSSPSADSYLGSLISLTSKSEIRYEGILAAINTSESTIALQNVRSFGTEGRKRDGIHVPPRNDVFEYILFRGSDIKDLQVKSPTASHRMLQMQHDPSIVQSQYAHTPTSYPSAVLSGSGTHAGTSSDAAQSAVGDLAFSNAYSLHQTGGQLGSGVSSPLPTSTHGAHFTAPMYVQRYADPLNVQSHGRQHSVAFRPSPAMQQNLLQQPEGHVHTSMPSLSGLATSPLSFSSTAVPSQHPIFNPADLSFSNPADLSSMSSAKSLLFPLSSSLPSPLLTMSSFSSYNPELNITMNPLSSKVGITSTSVLSVPCVPYTSSLTGSVSGPLTTGPLLTPDQLTNSEPPESPSVLKLYPEQKDMGALLPPSLSNLSFFGSVLPQAPLLPLPLPSQQDQQTVTDFGEEFDFTAMNEKFNKNEVWGSLGKTKQRETSGVGTIGNLICNNVEFEGVPDQDPRFRNKPVYNKDDFFDTLSCNSLNRNGRTRYSDRMMLDKETFGGQRPPLGRGNYGPAYTGSFQDSYNQVRGYGYYSGRGHGGYNLSHN